MSADQVCNLDDPHKDDYDDKTYAAIAFARAWALTQGEIKDEAVIAEFEKHYDEREREDVLGVIRIMNLSNKTVNSIRPPLNRERAFAAMRSRGD